MELYPGNSIEGALTNDELQFLYLSAGLMNSIVEIGSYFGKSAHALLSGCKGTVYCIDHFLGSACDETSLVAKNRDIREGFLNNVGHFGNLVLMTMDSIEAVKHFSDKSIDMIWIDGSHDYPSVKADLEVWTPKCIKLICGHDFNNEGVEKAVREKFPNCIETGVGTIWSVKL
jgi:predicted O-methyltransferase YrrM